MSEDKYQRFGKYLILDHLVDGGMAKICRASFLGEQANKIVAIKMVQAQYSKDPAYVQMFEDELNVTFGLVHPNIAQVYDYGMVDGQLYSAMEYVDGANLKQFLDRLKEKKFVFPVEISTFIISQVCLSLHYAHTYQDKLTGKLFNIIHRDISPHNIMLTYDGAVKLIDFGIAKADSNSESTQAGTIKGKLSYLAPEYLDGLELDHRYDQFAVGITLWEMLCSRKLFTAKNDLAVLKQIQGCKVPVPSSINPNVPAELDEIVMKALSKDRNNRYENMDKLNRALIKFLYSNYPDFNNSDLGYFAKQLFKEEILADRKKFVAYGKIDLKPYIKNMNAQGGSNSNTTTEKADDGSFISNDQRTGKIELDLGDFGDNEAAIEGLDLDNKLDGSSVTRTAQRKKIKSAVGVVPGANRTVKRAGGTRPAVRTRRGGGENKTSVTRVKTRARKTTKPTEEKKSGKNFIPYIAVAALLLVALFEPSFYEVIFGTVNKVTGNGQQKIIPQKKKEVGIITFSNLDLEMEIFVNGVKKELEGIDLRLPLNRNLRISVKKSGHKTWTKKDIIVLTEDSRRASIYVPGLKKESIGYLTTSNNYSPGSKMRFSLDGKTVEKALPFRNERLPAGKYDAVIINPIIGTEMKVRFEIKENRKNVLQD